MSFLCLSEITQELAPTHKGQTIHWTGGSYDLRNRFLNFGLLCKRTVKHISPWWGPQSGTLCGKWDHKQKGSWKLVSKSVGDNWCLRTQFGNLFRKGSQFQKGFMIGNLFIWHSNKRFMFVGFFSKGFLNTKGSKFQKDHKCPVVPVEASFSWIQQLSLKNKEQIKNKHQTVNVTTITKTNKNWTKTVHNTSEFWTAELSSPKDSDIKGDVLLLLTNALAGHLFVSSWSGPCW